VGNRRALLIVVAVVLAVVAFGGAFFLISGAEDNAKKDLAIVYVATQSIPAGATLDATMFKESRVESMPVGAVTPEAVVGKVALVEIPQNQTLVGSLVGDAAEAAAIGGTGTLASELQPGEEAITFSVDQVRGVGGFIQPGDTVNILVATTLDEGTVVYNLLLPNVSVLRTTPAAEVVATTTTAAGSAPTVTVPPASTGTITVKVTADGARAVATASQSQIYLSLNAAPPTTTAAPTTTKPATEDN